MENLAESLFESDSKVRILRLFMQNPDAVFPLPDIVRKTRLKTAGIRPVLSKLVRLGAVKKKTGFIRPEPKLSAGKGNRTQPRARRAIVYGANRAFLLFSELRDLIVNSSVAARKPLAAKIQKLGTVRLAILSGIFIRNDASRTDLLLVGDRIAPQRVEKFLAALESELGKQVRYTLMDTKEFRYRMDMYDRFLRDILEFPHEKLINRLGI